MLRFSLLIILLCGCQQKPKTAITINIQALIDTAYATGQQEIRLPAGEFHLTQPLILKSNNANLPFSTIKLIGAGICHIGETQFNGTVLVADFEDGPAISFQGARNSTIENLSIRGPYYSQLVWNPRGPNLADWPGNRNRYNPSAGIAFEKSSQAVTIKDVEITGFEVGVITCPTGDDGNSDFLSLERCTISFCVWGISISHTQARALVLDRCRDNIGLHTFITNRVHGKQSGEVDGIFTGCSFNDIEHLCDLNQAYAGPVTFQSCYGELITDLGDFYSGWARSATKTTFRDCHMNFLTKELLAKGAGATILLDGGIFETKDIVIADLNLECRGIKFRPAYYEQDLEFSKARKEAINLTRGLVIRSHPSIFNTAMEGIKTAAYFPDVNTNNQLANEGPNGPVRKFQVFPKDQCVYEDDTIKLPEGSNPLFGNILQSDQEGLTTWIIVKVDNDGITCKLERINNIGKTVDMAGNFYLFRSHK